MMRAAIFLWLSWPSPGSGAMSVPARPGPPSLGEPTT
jgi:hypothetical protein